SWPISGSMPGVTSAPATSTGCSAPAGGAASGTDVPAPVPPASDPPPPSLDPPPLGPPPPPLPPPLVLPPPPPSPPPARASSACLIASEQPVYSRTSPGRLWSAWFSCFWG